jgi:BMFP domain-containing protein YqiC
MEIEHRKSDILAQMLQNNVRDLVANLASAFEERDQLKARIAELEAQLPKEQKPDGA